MHSRSAYANKLISKMKLRTKTYKTEKEKNGEIMVAM